MTENERIAEVLDEVTERLLISDLFVPKTLVRIRWDNHPKQELMSEHIFLQQKRWQNTLLHIQAGLNVEGNRVLYGNGALTWTELAEAQAEHLSGLFILDPYTRLGLAIALVELWEFNSEIILAHIQRFQPDMLEHYSRLM